MTHTMHRYTLLTTAYVGPVQYRSVTVGVWQERNGDERADRWIPVAITTDGVVLWQGRPCFFRRPAWSQLAPVVRRLGKPATKETSNA